MHPSKHFIGIRAFAYVSMIELLGCQFYRLIRRNTLNSFFGVIHWSINSVNELLHSTFCLRTFPWKTSFSSYKMGCLQIMKQAQAGPKADMATQKSQFRHPTSKHSDAQVAYVVALSSLQHLQLLRSWGKTCNVWGNLGAALAKRYTPPWVTDQHNSAETYTKQLMTE